MKKIKSMLLQSDEFFLTPRQVSLDFIKNVGLQLQKKKLELLKKC